MSSMVKGHTITGGFSPIAGQRPAADTAPATRRPTPQTHRLADLSGRAGSWMDSVMAAPLVMNPTLESFRTDGQCASTGGYGSLCDIGHQGLLHDKEFGPAATGLVHNRARTLNPTLGRFMQRDPGRSIAGISSLRLVAGRRTGNMRVGASIRQYADGLSLCQYIGSHPMGATDPMGEEVVIDPRGVGSKIRDLVSGKWISKKDFAERAIKGNIQHEQRVSTE